MDKIIVSFIHVKLTLDLLENLRFSGTINNLTKILI